MGVVTKLRLELIERGLTQTRLAQEAGINRALVNMITTGRLRPDQRQKELIAGVLKCEPKQLFPD